MGNVHARHLREMPEVTLGYRDNHPDRADSFHHRWQAQSFNSSDELIAWADIVDICLPTYLHKEFALQCIAAGKAVFLEKPIALTLADGEEILEAAAKSNVPLMIGMVVRFFPEYVLGRRLVKDGVLGRPAAVRTHRGGPAPTGSNGWFMNHELSGGILVDQAIHDFDWLRWMLGEVSVLYSRSTAASVGHGPDYAVTTMTFDCGAVAHVESTWMDPSGFRTAFEIAGSEGLAEFDSRNSAAVKTFLPGDTRYEASLSQEDDPYFRELSAFVTAVKTGTPPPVTGHDGLVALGLSLAALESAKTGKVIRPARI
jgi:predicted dehydrogenase